MQHIPDIAIVGGGAIGGLLASYFTQAQIPVTLILKDTIQLAHYQQLKGLHVQKGDTEIHHHLPAETGEQTQPLTYLFIALKAHAIAPALQRLKHRLTQHTTIILMNNGLGIVEEIAELNLGIDVVSMSHYLAATVVAPFHIQARGESPLWLGTAQHTAPTPTQAELLKLLAELKLTAHWCTDIETHLWHKFAVNCVINPITALLRTPNGIFLDNPALEALSATMCREIVDVAKHHGIKLTVADLQKQVKTVASATQANYSSMLQDRTAGRMTEMNYLNGYLVHLAKRYNLTVPYNELLATLINVGSTQNENKQSTHFAAI